MIDKLTLKSYEFPSGGYMKQRLVEPTNLEIMTKVNEVIDFVNETRVLLAKQYDNKETDVGKQLHNERNYTGHDEAII